MSHCHRCSSVCSRLKRRFTVDLVLAGVFWFFAHVACRSALHAYSVDPDIDGLALTTFLADVGLRALLALILMAATFQRIAALIIDVGAMVRLPLKEVVGADYDEDRL